MSSLKRWIYAGDGIHLSAGLLLAGWILRTQTCKGISGRTQTIIFMASIAKFVYFIVEYISSSYSICVVSVLAVESIIIMYLIFIKFKKTVEKAYDTFWIEVIIIISGALAIVYSQNASDPFDVLYAGSYYLESVSILPQMYFNFRTGSKNLGVSLYVLLCAVYKSFHVYYAVQTDQYYTPVTLYPGNIQLGTYAVYFTLLVVIPKYKEEKLILDLDSISASFDELSFDGENQPPVIIVTRPALDRQQSRLEMPFLKKTLPSSSSLIALAASNGSHSSSKINTPAIQKKPYKLKNVESSPNFKINNSEMVTLKRTHSASSIVSLGRESLVDSQEEGITFKIKETAREGRQRRMAYVRQTSLPEKKSSHAQADELKNDELNKNLEENFSDQCIDGQDAGTKPGEECVPVPSVSDDQMINHARLQANGRIQANEMESMRKISNPTPRRPSFPDAGLEKKRRKRTISTSPDFHRKSRRATMHHPGSPQQHNWKILATTFIGTNPQFSSPSSTIHQSDMLAWPDSSDEHLSPRFEARKKRRATLQALNTQHHSSWKTLASGLIGTSLTPQSPMSARFPAATPVIRRTSTVARSNSDSKCLDGAKNQRRATVQLTPAMSTVKKRSSWQKLTDGFTWISPAAGRRVSSPVNLSADQRQKISKDQGRDVIEEDAEGQD